MGCTSSSAKGPADGELVTDPKLSAAIGAARAENEPLVKPAVLTNSIGEKIYVNGRPVQLPANAPQSAEAFSTSLVSSYGTQSIRLEASAYNLSYAFVSKQLKIPLASARSTKACWAKTAFNGDEEQLCLGVVDGEGQHGGQCAAYAKSELPNNIMQAMTETAPPQGALTSAFERTSLQLNNNVSDDENSGAKVIAALVQGRNIHLAHIGDCSAVAAAKDGVRWKAAPPLHGVQGASSFHTQAASGGLSPRVSLERDRDSAPVTQALGVSKRALDPTSPPSSPKTGPIKDSEDIVSQPNLDSHRMTPLSPTLVLFNKGALAYLTDDDVIDVVCNGEDTHDLQHAALKLVTAAYASWLDNDGACNNDITVLLLQGSGFVEDSPGVFHADPYAMSSVPPQAVPIPPQPVPVPAPVASMPAPMSHAAMPNPAAAVPSRAQPLISPFQM
ncbi:hypothetical protein WJX74_010268 [Apatococcus lobatus]|uniref:PPM-type phosphatase domain-containing protein n=1 Tax=Apatococcus lobatus TaxID=904363 RepID=A0AAW1QNI6_9CHLO